MRLPITLLGILCLTAISTVSAQTESKVVWGEVFEAGKSREIYGFASDDEEAYYFVKKTVNNKDAGNLTKLDSKLNLVLEKPLEKPDNGKGNSLRGSSFYDGKLSLIFSSYKDKTEQYVSQKFDTSTLSKEDGPKIMTEVFPSYIGVIKNNVDYGEVIKSESRDFSKRVFAYSSQGFSPEKASFGISVTDETDKMLYSAEFESNHSSSNLNRLAVAVGNDGTSYVLARIVSGERKDVSSELRIWKFNPDGSSAGDISVSFPDKIISKMGMQIAPDGSVICAGVFSYESLSGAQGTAFISIDADEFSVSLQKSEDFPSGLIEQSSGSKKLNGYDLVKFQGPIILDNGNTVFGIEQYEGNIQPLVYKDILVFEFGKNGDISKTGIIRKEQNGSDDYYSYLSYKLVAKGNKTYVIYIDKAKNTEVPGNEKHAKCIITGFFPAIIAELTSNGFSKEVACENNDVKMRVAIEYIQQTQEGNLIFMRNQISGDNSGMQFGKLEL